MRLTNKLFKKSLYKISVALFLIAYNFMPVALAAEEISNLDSDQSVSATTEDNKGEILNGISDPGWIAEPIVWNNNGRTSVTNSPVVLGEKYVAPQNSEVSVTFTKLPENPSPLSITEITLTQEEIDATGAVSNKAYDITTGMADGTFEFDLTLPKVGKAEKVVYAENRSELLTDLKEVSKNVIDEGNLLKVENLNHFTIYISAGNIRPSISAYVNGQSSVVVQPNTELTIRVTVTTSGSGTDNDWRTTRYQVGSADWVCIDTDNHSSDGTYYEEFDIDAPSTLGVYNLSLQAFNGNNCSGGSSNVYTMSNAITVISAPAAISLPTLPNNPGDTYKLTSTSGIWTATNGGSGVTGINTQEVRWGDSWGQKSGLRFDNSGVQTFNEGASFYLGALTHYNYPVNNAANGATLKITLDFDRPNIPNQEFSFNFAIDETSNDSGECPSWQQTDTPCDDKITFPNSYGTTSFQIGDKLYTLKIVGFVNSYPSGSPVSEFITEERKTSTAYLVGQLSSILVERPAISIMKKVNDNDANTAPGIYIGEGDPVNFTYIVQNTGNVALTNIQVTDNKGVQVSCPQTTLAAGANMTCTGSATAIFGLYTNIGTVVGSHTGGTVTANDPANYTGVKKVDICHATGSQSNPYSDARASMTADAGGHDGHNGPVWFPGITVTWGDIIPPFDYQGGHYPGKNYDAYGQSVLANGCTVPTGTLKVNKVTVPAGDSAQFGITGTGSSVEGAPTFMNGNTGTISSSTPHTFTVYPGTYSVSETAVTGWTETSNTCKNIVIAKGENKECTITNARYGSLTIVKNANPSSEQVFSFTTTGTGLSAFTLVDNSNSSNPNKVFENLLPGTYSVSETVPSGWYLDSASCTDNSPLTAINLSAGENIICTFNNIKYGSISGHKWNDFDGIAGTADDKLNPIQGWTIFIDANNNNTLDAGEVSMLTGFGGLYTFSNLKPGTYKIMEVLQLGWINITGKSQEITITAGENKTNIDFSNAKYPTIQVIKKVDTNGDGNIDIENATDWTWKIGTTDTYNTGGDPVEKMPGTYTISEVQKDNYHITSLVCTKGGTEIYNGVSESTSVALQSGDNVVCTFTNTRDTGTLIVKKIVVNDNGGTLEADDFSFKVNDGVATSFISTANPLLGENTITKVLTGTYSITEVEANQRGYTTTYDKCSEVTVSKGNETICTITNNDNKPSLTLVKEVVNDNGGQLKPEDWTLTATGPVTVTGAGGATSGNDFEAGTYTLSEVGKTGVDTSGYEAGNWSCTNNIAVSNNQITIGLGQSTVCTIINNDIAPSLELVKVVKNDFGGNAVKTDWTLSATGTLTEPTNLSGAGGATSGLGFKADTYTLAEIGSVTGYSASDWSCTNNISVSNNQITLGLGKSTVCTITNTEIQPTLTLVKTVVNSYGGNKGIADFNLYIGDTKVTSGVATGVSSGVEYTVREDQLSGYTASTWGTDCSTDGKITLKSGENKTCTITNSDIAPTLKVVKKAINDNGGTATISNFGITLTDTTLSFGNGVANGTTTTYEATPTVVSNKAYTLGETGATGYTQESLQCLDGETNLGSTFTLNPGQNVICTIVNNDIAPKLTLNKIVSNTHGGSKLESAWTLYAKQGETVALSGRGAAGDNDVVSDGKLIAGSYTLSEQGPTGYDASTWSCTGTGSLTGNVITLTVGQEAVCTITNSDRAAGLTVVKNVINDNGGTAVVGNFEIKLNNNLLAFGTGSVNGTTTTYTSTPSVDSNTAYTLSEIDHVGYVEGTWSCKDNSTELPVSHPVTLSEGQGVTCTITNNDIAPTLKLVKSVTNDNGGTLESKDWTLTATGEAGFNDLGNSTTFHTVKAGVGYTLSESVVAGYTSEGWKCDKGTLNGSTITLGLAENVTCTITNNDIQPKLTVTKVVENGAYGDKKVADFNLYVSGTSVTSGDTNSYNAGDYTVSEENIDGYVATINGDCDKDGKVSLSVGDEKSCTITNRSTYGKIIIKKQVEPNTNTTTFSFSGDLTGTIGNNGTIEKIVVPGDYSVTETSTTGWNLKGLTCVDATNNSVANGYTANIKVADNETVTCTFTNEKLGKISGYKYEDKNGNKTWDEGEVALSGWTINNGQGGSTTTDGNGYYEFTNLPVGNKYTITETQKDGWTQISTNPSEITIKAGDDIKDINFGNFKHVTINVTKDVVGIDKVTDVKDDTTFTAQLNGADGKLISEKATATYTVTKPDKYTVSEFDVVDYEYLGCFLGDVNFTDYSVESGQTYNIVCKNAQLPAKLIVTKNVVNSKGIDEGVFSDEQFDIVLGEETKQISDTANGKNKATFEGLQPGEHTFTETPKDGYIFEGCTNDGKVTLESNKTVEVVCTNKVIDPLLKIEKSNDKQFIDQYAGNEVTYKIIVTAPLRNSLLSEGVSTSKYILNNVVVSDIAPKGFNYLTGTWSANSSVRGNIKPAVTTEPTYDGTNSAKWNLGKMIEGEIVTLTYKTKISLLTDPGVYPDIAWVKGVSVSNNDVLGNVSTGATTPFVGTDVTVIEPVETEEGEVLGATTYLPNTGANTYLILGALITMILGILALLFRPFKKVKYALLTLVMAVGIFLMVLPTTVSAYDTLQVRIEKPQSPTAKKSFNIDFTAQDINEGAITVDCYKDAVKIASFTANSGSCPVTVADSGTYSFYVIATAGVETKQSDTVTVVVDLEKPSAVTGYSKNGNVLKFTTANDGRTSKVEIFRSEKPSFTANATTRIDTMNVVPNTPYTYTDSTAQAGTTYYYAVRAVDAQGNVSTLVSDPVVLPAPATTTTPGTAATATTVGGNTDGEVAGQADSEKKNDGEVAGEKTDETENSQTNEEGKTENGTSSESKSEVVEKAKNYWYIWVPVLVVIAGSTYFYVKKQKRI